jgi:hypothetical protein
MPFGWYNATDMRGILVSIASFHSSKVSRSHASFVAIHGFLHLSCGNRAILNLVLDFPPCLLQLDLDLSLIE